MVAQVATSRLLYAMARDRQLPSLLARVSVRRSVPVNAVLLTAAVSLGLGLYMASRADGINVLVSLVNFGAMVSFTVLHVAVVWRWAASGRTGGTVRNVIVPLVGAGILIAVVVKMNILAQRVGFVWLGLGVLVLAALYATGRRPHLSGLDSDTDMRVPVGAGHRA
jgi:amino acid transporter